MGLLADERIFRGTFLGEYEGPRVHDEDNHDDSCDRVALFQITRTTCINAIKDPGNTFFINCRNDRTYQNAEFLYVEGKARRKVVAVSRKNFPKGREIFASYGYCNSMADKWTLVDNHVRPNTEWIFEECSTHWRPRKHSKSADLIHDGKPLTLGDYVFIKGGTDDENYPWIAKVESILEHERIRIWWASFPHTVKQGGGISHGLKEVLLSNHLDVVDKGCLMGRAAVEEHCADCQTAEHWFWSRQYNVHTRKIQ
ncbi:hypothetical protein LTR66_008757 [Elasticomyces elasticus]|nr:hypothetical protein LTR66_008757 [Elasticomyces elasticus]